MKFKSLISLFLILALASEPIFAGKSYSSGSTSSRPSTSSSRPSTSSSRPSTSSSRPSTAPSKPSTPTVKTTGKAYSSGNTSSKPATASSNSSSTSRKPTSSGYNNALSTSAKKEESRIKYEAATAPKATYKTSTGQTKPVVASSPQVNTIRNTVTHERYVTYDHRCSSFYGGYYGHPVFYNDYFSPFLMGWILSDAINSHDRALWMYHHQSDMDAARYSELLKRDARLQAEIDQLKAQKVAVDGGYVPAQMKDNPDIMYNKDFVDSSYNEIATEQPDTDTGIGTIFLYIILAIVFLIIGAIFINFLFVKEYQ